VDGQGNNVAAISNEVFNPPPPPVAAEAVPEEYARQVQARIEAEKAELERKKVERMERKKKREDAEKRAREAREAEQVRLDAERKRLDEIRDQARQKATAGVKARLDGRYYAVRSIRAARPAGRELNRNKRVVQPDTVGVGFQAEDERWIRNYNIHNIERAVNVSISFNPRLAMCYTCLGRPHKAFQGKDGEPIALVLSDQAFPANVPAIDGGECVRVMRVEDGSLQELVNEFLAVVKKWMVVPGSIIMLGSLSQLGKEGTAWYTSEWVSCRNKLKWELGDVIVTPLIPLMTLETYGRHVVRSLVEFLDWADDLQDTEMMFLKGVRDEYAKTFLVEEEGADRWADELQNLRMPISLSGEGTTLYKSRNLGGLPTSLPSMDEHEEQVWLGHICRNLNRDLNLSLATSVASGRTLAAVRELEDEGSMLEFAVAGASNADKSVAALARKGLMATKVGKAGWSLAVEKDVSDAIAELKSMGMERKVLIFHCMDNGCFFSMNRTGGSSLPKRVNKKYHIPGKLVVASGGALEMMTDEMARVIKEVKPLLTVVITPMPRYLDPCCDEHAGDKSEERRKEEQEKLLKAVWSIKRETFQFLAKAHCKNTIVVGPMEVFNLKDSIEGVRSAMDDGIHLNQGMLGLLMDHVIMKTEENLAGRKKGPTERAGPAVKKARVASDGGYRGVPRGGMGGKGGGGGAAGRRSYSSY
jgi:hypothetical protein